MVDLNAEMADLWASLNGAQPGRARVVQMVAARPGEGTSTVARELALFAARRAGRSVWLVDLDLFASPQHAAIAADPAHYGALGPTAAASPDGSIFFTIQPASRTPAGQPWPAARYLAAHRVGQARWWVTRFRREALKPRQSVHVLPGPAYWDALRKYADLVIVDCPSIDRSKAALTLAPFMDETVLVVATDEADTRAPVKLRDDITGAGGRVAGLFVNRVAVEPPSFLKALRR
jgi:Mrp family chromosome partitioning ATPase